MVQSARNGARTRAVLLATQVALTLVLLVGAGLFVRSLRKVQGIDLGFDADRVLNVTMDLSGSGFEQHQANAVYLQVAGSHRRIPRC